MRAKDIGAYIVYKQSLVPATRTTTGNGTGVDRQGFLSCKAVLDLGAASGTAATLDAKIQDSADNTTFADLAGATLAQVGGTSDNSVTVKDLDLSGAKRYLRAVATIAGTTPSFDCSVAFVLGGADVVPAAD